MESLLQEFASRIKVTDEVKQLITTSFQYEEVPAKTILLNNGDYCRKIWFIEKGILRTFYDHEDMEVTSWFYIENQTCSSWYSFFSQQVTYESIEALEDCQLYSIGYQDYQRLLSEHHMLERYGRLLAESQLSFLDSYYKAYQFLSAKERYDLLVGYIPNIELRVKLGYIASFLGISQATLSRLRAGK